MITRRDCMKYTGAAGAWMALNPILLRAQSLAGQRLITRRIPATGEELPIIGLGSSATFRAVAQSDLDALRDVLSTLVDNGGTVFDTAPSYGTSEEVAGRLVNELGIRDRLFWASKVNVARRGGGAADPAEARAQIEESFVRAGKSPIDLMQVHNLGDVPTQLGILRELKEAGRVRYIGVTTTDADRYDEIAAIMRSEPIDFIGVDYAVDNRDAARVVLPLAAERGIGVLVYAPFGRTRLWSRVRGRELPAWAADLDADSWAQFFLKYVISHPAVTVATPATSKAENMLDNLGGGIGRLPDAATRQRMEALIDALPSA